MIDDEIYIHIRQLESEGMSQRNIATTLQISRKTVRKYLGGAYLPGERSPLSQAMELKANSSLADAIVKLLKDESKDGVRTKKQRLKASSIYRALRKQGRKVSERTVGRALAMLRKEKGPEFFGEPRETVDLDLEFEPGEVMQVDWCLVKVFVNNILCDVPIFCTSLPYSSSVFCSVFPNMTTASFFEGHVKAFEYLNGVPKRIFYDNLKTAVNKDWGKKAITQKNFQVFQAHYNYESLFMNRAKGNEKGSVENVCKIAESNFFTPIPRVRSLKELQDNISAQIIEYNNIHKIKTKKLTVAELLEIEKTNLKQLPITPKNNDIVFKTTVHDNSTIEYNTNKYSVPEDYAQKQVTVVIKPYNVDIYYQGKLIATHDHCPMKYQKVLMPQHFLKTLQMKPRAVDHSAALTNYKCSDTINEYLSLYPRKSHNKILLDILIIQEEVGEIKLNEIIKDVLKNKNADINYLYEIANVKNNNVLNAHDYNEINVPNPNFEVYKSLMETEDDDN
jgi:transposase